MTITMPNNNISERKYILDVLIDEFLGLKFELDFTDLNEWQICLDNGKKLIIKDSFFCKFTADFEYLKLENIPNSAKFGKNKFTLEQDIPILYGDECVEIRENEIICGIDVFASSFFMLTRWEEYVNKVRDKHDRFSGKDSLACKFGFLNRPIVNEYTQMLKNMIFYLDSNIKFKEHLAQTIVTCDVDEPFDYACYNIKNLIRRCGRDLLIRQDFKMPIDRIKRYILNKFDKSNTYKYDKNYIFEWYISICGQNGLRPRFYFIPDNSEKGNGCYFLEDKKIQNLLKFIDDNDCEIGVHGSYNTYKDSIKMKKQKNTFENICVKLDINQKIIGNRQHYLRWDSSITPKFLDEAGFEYDTTGSYADVAGFRYGVCYQFCMFDFLNRQKLNIKELPLIVMESSVLEYMGFSYKDAIKYILNLKQKCYKYDGNFVILWHNSSFVQKQDKRTFEEILITNVK